MIQNQQQTNPVLTTVYKTKKENISEIREYWKTMAMFLNQLTVTFEQFSTMLTSQADELFDLMEKEQVYTMGLFSFFLDNLFNLSFKKVFVISL